MASIRDLKKRIGTVKNTQQTTKAMKMVSAAKLRRSQEAILSQRPYAKQINHLIQVLTNRSDLKIKSPFFNGKNEKPLNEKTVLLVVITSDRGLCGGFNSSIIKKSSSWLKENETKYKKVKFGFVGKKGYEFYKNRGRNPEFYFEFGKTISFLNAKRLMDKTLELFLNEQCDEVHFVYSEFKNAMTQLVGVEKFLPISPLEITSNDLQQSENLYLVKPNTNEVIEQLLKKNFSIQAFRILLDSQASEHGARMSAMENATKNAGEMIRGLTLQYNKQRQAGITKELLEIIAGSESQKS